MSRKSFRKSRGRKTRSTRKSLIKGGVVDEGYVTLEGSHEYFNTLYDNIAKNENIVDKDGNIVENVNNDNTYYIILTNLTQLTTPLGPLTYIAQPNTKFRGKSSCRGLQTKLMLREMSTEEIECKNAKAEIYRDVLKKVNHLIGIVKTKAPKLEYRGAQPYSSMVQHLEKRVKQLQSKIDKHTVTGSTPASEVVPQEVITDTEEVISDTGGRKSRRKRSRKHRR